MISQSPWRASSLALLCAAILLTSGCGYFRRARSLYRQPPRPAPNGAISDPIFSNMESNAEANDFIVYEHEFKYQMAKMNEYGQDHMKQIASRILDGQDMPVMVQRSHTSTREDTEYKYPVHFNPELDMQRREVVVRSLVALGIQDAEERVLVSPDLRPGYKAPEATNAYNQGLSNYGGFGGGFGGGGFGGGFGGFGGGGFF